MTDISIQNLENPIGQLAKRWLRNLVAFFFCNNIENSKKNCKSSKIRDIDAKLKLVDERTLCLEKAKSNFRRMETSHKRFRIMPRCYTLKRRRIQRIQINLPFAKAFEQMPLYARFMKDL
ncbi:hypothetical protein CR513_35782, partial [Mucuna pruriens]